MAWALFAFGDLSRRCWLVVSDDPYRASARQVLVRSDPADADLPRRSCDVDPLLLDQGSQLLHLLEFDRLTTFVSPSGLGLCNAFHLAFPAETRRAKHRG